jgi:hypothetical protein
MQNKWVFNDLVIIEHPVLRPRLPFPRRRCRPDRQIRPHLPRACPGWPLLPPLALGFRSMGHSLSSHSKSSLSSLPRRSRSLSPMGPPLRLTTPMQIAAEDSGSGSSSSFAPPARDYTHDLPDEILTIVFTSLSPTDRNACSLTCSHWMEVDATTRHRLSLDARAALGNAAPAWFTAVTKLALRWARGSGADSLSDYDVVAVTETYYGVGRRVGRRRPSRRWDLRAGGRRSLDGGTNGVWRRVGRRRPSRSRDLRARGGSRRRGGARADSCREVEHDARVWMPTIRAYRVVKINYEKEICFMNKFTFILSYEEMIKI